MSDQKQAVDFVMRQEDSTLAGTITDRPTDRGGCTRFGLTERWHPELAAKGFFEVENGKPKISTADAMAMAEAAYESDYSPALGIATLSSQAVATALLSIGVLEGPSEAVAMLQKAVNAVTPPPAQKKSWDYTAPAPEVAVTGKIDDETVKAANEADPVKLRNSLVAFGQAYFEHLVSVVPAQVVNLRGWMNRMSALLALDAGAATPAAAAATQEASATEA